MSNDCGDLYGTKNPDWYAANDGSGTNTTLYGDCRNPALTGNGVVSTCASTSTCGYLYNWQAVVQNANVHYDDDRYYGAEGNDGGIQGICPPGWVVPTGNSLYTYADFYVLYHDAANSNINFFQPTGPWKGTLAGYCDGRAGAKAGAKIQ